MKKPRIISITGTKGKTTVAYIVDEILRKSNLNTLRVDTNGHYVNGQQRSTATEDINLWGSSPNVCPGKFLYEFLINEELAEGGIAILEAGFGSSGSVGLGYRRHKVGVFLNVFNDHTHDGYTRLDLAKDKAFVFRQVEDTGKMVFNADDDLVCGQLSDVASESVQLIACGRQFSPFGLQQHLDRGGVAFAISDNNLELLGGGSKKIILNLAAAPLTFEGNYEPMMLNLMYAIATVYATLDGNLPENIDSIVKSLKLDPFGGRLTRLQSKDGTLIIADYAHEQVSITEVGNLARTLCGGGNGKTIGIIRGTYDRDRDIMSGLGVAAGKVFDQVIVYDKIDGHHTHPDASKDQAIGKTATIIADAAKSVNSNVTLVLREDEALGYAAEISGGDDVVVAIVNQPQRSIGYIKEKFAADFI